jgi:hypothetical protein
MVWHLPNVMWIKSGAILHPCQWNEALLCTFGRFGNSVFYSGIYRSVVEWDKPNLQTINKLKSFFYPHFAPSLPTHHRHSIQID